MRGQVLGDVADVLVLGAPGQDLVADDEEGGGDDVAASAIGPPGVRDSRARPPAQGADLQPASVPAAANRRRPAVRRPLGGAARASMSRPTARFHALPRTPRRRPARCGATSASSPMSCWTPRARRGDRPLRQSGRRCWGCSGAGQPGLAVARRTTRPASSATPGRSSRPSPDGGPASSSASTPRARTPSSPRPCARGALRPSPATTGLRPR